jgi:hypothetical protein
MKASSVAQHSEGSEGRSPPRFKGVAPVFAELADKPYPVTARDQHEAARDIARSLAELA